MTSSIIELLRAVKDGSVDSITLNQQQAENLLDEYERLKDSHGEMFKRMHQSFQDVRNIMMKYEKDNQSPP